MQPDDRLDPRRFIARASGNELKIILAIRQLEALNLPTSADAISAEAMINRSTVYRLLPRLAANQWIEYRLTADGRMMAEYALTSLVTPVASYITDTPGPSSKCLPGSFTGNDPQSQNATPREVNPSHFATESHPETHATLSADPNVKNRTKTDSTFGAAHERAKEWARFSHRAVEQPHDQNPPKHLGYHLTVWRMAIYLDDQEQGHPWRAEQLHQLVQTLQDRIRRNEGPQGRAWTARTKHLLATWNK